MARDYFPAGKKSEQTKFRREGRATQQEQEEAEEEEREEAERTLLGEGARGCGGGAVAPGFQWEENLGGETE